MCLYCYVKIMIFAVTVTMPVDMTGQARLQNQGMYVNRKFLM